MAPAAKRLTNSRATNFYYSFLFLPPEKRRAIEAVYHFARHSDDATDLQSDRASAAREIARYRAMLDQCFATGDGPLASPALEALREAVRRFALPRGPFDELLLGLEMDLRMDQTGELYRTIEDLEVYCYRVASAIGLIAIEIFGYRNPKTREYAVNLGKALQMVNILRDIESDARRKRVYLPSEDLGRFGIDPCRLSEGRYDAALARLMSFEGARAREYFASARRLLPDEDRESMRPAEIMGAIYWKLLGSIEARAFNVFGQKVRLSRPRKLWTALSVRMGAEWHT
ncbi:MAG: phytoene/squalene synthase family protein [Terriglobia bacterium]